MLVDHFLDFKGCSLEEHKREYNPEKCMGLSEFYESCASILEDFPQLCQPSFAQEKRYLEIDHNSDDSIMKTKPLPMISRRSVSINRWIMSLMRYGKNNG